MSVRSRLTLAELGEFGLIRRAAGIFGQRGLPGLVKGIGDDAAVVKVGHNKAIVATTDMLIEDIHFSLKYEGFFDIGWKALAVNLSDMAAMGATPKWGLISIGLPVGISVDSVDKLSRGIATLARKYRVGIIGGDTVKSPGKLVINLAVLGEATPGEVIYRQGARPGDFLFVSGRIGEAAAGLAILQKKLKSRQLGASAGIVRKYLRPEPRLKESNLIVKYGLASSMIDISDGLHLSAKFICEPSRVGAKIYIDKIPVNHRLLSANRERALSWALSGGEDYELLFTVPPAKVRKALALFPGKLIGEITGGRDIKLLDKNRQEIDFKSSGYDHFKNS